MTRFGTAVVGLVLAFAAPCAQAQEAEASDPPPAYADRPALDPDDTNQLLLELIAEIAAMRESMDEMQKQMTSFMTTTERALREENARLRQAVELRYGQAGESGSRLPIPNGDLIDEVLAEASEPPAPVEKEFSYTVVKEWGRTPEEAARFDGEALKGMVLAVPDWSTDADLASLGVELREQFDGYGNINIEVFDSLAAAQEFAAEGRTQLAEDRVLNISRYETGGRDLILLIRGDEVTEIVPGEAPDGETAEGHPLVPSAPSQ